MLLSISALCWFLLVHGPTVLRALGVDAADPSFLAERRRHVVNLVVQGLRGGWVRTPAPLNANRSRRAGAVLLHRPAPKSDHLTGPRGSAP